MAEMIGVGAIFALSVGFTRLAIAYARQNRIVDAVNERSSHTVETLRGGGIGLAVALGVGVAWLTFTGGLTVAEGLAFGVGGFMIAAVGWIDDRYDLRARTRIVVHLAAAIWGVAWLGGYPAFPYIGPVVAVVATVWLLNLYNFMDGIDGIAGSEAFFVGTVGGGLLIAAGAGGLGTWALCIAAASAGFLVWNWPAPPVKIFMGDVGSALLGYLFALLAVAGENAGALPATVWLVLLAVFILDATFTLLRRMRAGERWYAAHRSHAYQRLTQMGLSHTRVTGGIWLVNLLLLAPPAVAVSYWPNLMAPILVGVAVAGFVGWRSILTRFRAFGGAVGRTPE